MWIKRSRKYQITELTISHRKRVRWTSKRSQESEPTRISPENIESKRLAIAIGSRNDS